MKEKVPKESETIAVRRSRRLFEKLKAGGEKLGVRTAWWSNTLVEVISLSFVLGLNFYLIYPYLALPPLSISFSGPLIPFLAKLVSALGVSFPQAIVDIEVIFFLLLPLTLYLFIKKIAGRKLIALLSSIFASFPFYPFALSRIQGLFFWGDGPYIASLTLIPLAVYFLLVFLREGHIKNLVLTSVVSTLVALTSPFGLFILIGVSFLTTFSEMLLGKGRVKLVRFLAVLVVTFGLSSFWYHPVFAWALLWGDRMVDFRETIKRLIPISFFVIPVLGTFGYLLFDRKPNLQPTFLASFFTIAFGITLLAGGGLAPSSPSRYIPIFGLSLSFLLSIVVVTALDWLRFFKGEQIANLALGGLVFLSVLIMTLVRTEPRVEQEKVLGLWTDVNKGEIWLSREQFGGVSMYLGYLVSGGTLLSISYLGLIPIVKKKPENHS